MNESCLSAAYEEDVEQFLQFALEKSRPDENKKFFCPCINCLKRRRQKVNDICEHMLCDGIKKNYTMWIWHGELTDMQSKPINVFFTIFIGGVGLTGFVCRP